MVSSASARRRAVLAAGLLLASLSSARASDADLLLSALNRAAQFTVRGEASITVAFPPHDPPTRTAPALPPVKVYPKLVAQNFEIKLGEPETVAGRATQVFTLRPKVGSAASWRLWIDREWNVPLAYEERGADGTLARRAQLVRVDKLQKRADAVSQTLRAEPSPGLGQALKLAWPGLKLPPGFQAVSVKARKVGAELTLSDGLNVLALVAAPKGVKAARGVASRKVGSTFVWLVGNLDAQTLQAALSGVRGSDLGALGTFLLPGDSNP